MNTARHFKEKAMTTIIYSVDAWNLLSIPSNMWTAYNQIFELL